MNTNVLFSSATPDWPTPQWLYDELHAEFRFDFDPCPHLSDPDRAFFQHVPDGLSQDWSGIRAGRSD